MFPRDVEDRNDEVPFNPPRFEFNIGPLKSSFAVNLICWTFQLFNKWPIFFIISSKFEEKKDQNLCIWNIFEIVLSIEEVFIKSILFIILIIV